MAIDQADFDLTALYDALDEQRRAGQMSWAAVLSEGGRIGFPRVMRLVRWLGQPAAAFTRIADW